MNEWFRSEQLFPEAAMDAEPMAPDEAEAPLPDRQFCIFRVGRELYGLSVLQVEEVIRLTEVTRVPLAPPFLLGISNLRGIIVPVVDIAFGEVRAAALPPRLIVAVADGGQGQDALRVGLAADEVIGTYVTNEPLLTDKAPRKAPWCCGMLRHDNGLALVVNLGRLTEAFPIATI